MASFRFGRLEGQGSCNCQCIFTKSCSQILVCIRLVLSGFIDSNEVARSSVCDILLQNLGRIGCIGGSSICQPRGKVSPSSQVMVIQQTWPEVMVRPG